jgi:acetyl esterase/lipase
VSVRLFEPEVGPNERLPVMIYIHGGGFTIGTGKDSAMTYVGSYHILQFSFYTFFSFNSLAQALCS